MNYYNDRDLTITNKILSSKQRAVFLLGESSIEYISNLFELQNNYRKTYWFNSKEVFNEYFSLSFAKKIHPDMFNSYLQYFIAEDVTIRSFEIIDISLDYLADKEHNSLIVFDHLEELNEKAMCLLEYILYKVPQNVKIVLISNKYINFNYNAIKEGIPEYIDFTFPNADVNYNEFISYFSEEELKIVACLSFFDNIPIDFIKTVYPQIYAKLKPLSTRYYNIAMALGVYYIKLNRILFDKLHLDNENLILLDKIQEQLLDYFCENGLFNHALFVAFNSINEQKIIKVIQNFIYKSQLSFMIDKVVHSFIYEVKHFSGKSEWIQFLKAKALTFNLVTLKEATEKFIEIAKTTKDLKLKIICLEEVLKQYNKEKELSHLYFDYVVNECNSLIEMGIHTKDLVYVLTFLLNAASKIDKSLTNTIMQFNLDRILANENINEFWYISLLQALSFYYTYNGDSANASKYLYVLRNKFSFYLVPPKLLITLYFSYNLQSLLDAIEKYDMYSQFIQNENLLQYIKAIKALAIATIGNYRKVKEILESINTNAGFILMLKSFIYAYIGDVEYAKDFALLLSKKPEFFDRRSQNYINAVIAYSYWRLQDKDNAMHYAKLAISNNKTYFSYIILAYGIIFSYDLSTEDPSVLIETVSSFIKKIKRYGQGIVISYNINLFSTLIKFCITHNIEPEYIRMILNKQENSVINIKERKQLDIKFFGNSSATIGGDEIIWKTKKAKELFLYYVYFNDKTVERNKILNEFWHDYVYSSAINNLKTTNNTIRKTLDKYEITYELNYVNLSYQMSLKDFKTDIYNYRQLINKYNAEPNLSNKTILIAKIINIYGAGFIIDSQVDFFDRIGNAYKDELTLILVRFIKELIKHNDFIEAKRFLTSLKHINATSEYIQLLEVEILKNANK